MHVNSQGKRQSTVKNPLFGRQIQFFMFIIMQNVEPSWVNHGMTIISLTLYTHALIMQYFLLHFFDTLFKSVDLIGHWPWLPPHPKILLFSKAYESKETWEVPKSHICTPDGKKFEASNLQAGRQKVTGESRVKAAVLFLLSFPKGLQDAASLVRRARLLRKRNRGEFS